MPQHLKQQLNATQSCDPSFPGVHLVVVSAGPGRVQRWLVGYVERWEDDEDGYVSKNFLRAGWHLHERTNPETAEHPIADLTYTSLDAFQEQATPHKKQRSHMESARRAIAQLCREGALEESVDKRSVRLPAVTTVDDDLTRRLVTEREYLKAHGRSASDELLVVVTGNIVVVELERRLTLKERMSFNTRCIEQGDVGANRVRRLVDYVAIKHNVRPDQVLGEAVDEARRTLGQWREEDQ